MNDEAKTPEALHAAIERAVLHHGPVGSLDDNDTAMIADAVVREVFEQPGPTDMVMVAHTIPDLLYEAWGVIANVSEGRWDDQPAEWVDAATRWRNRWHATLPASPLSPVEGEPTDG